MLSKQSSEDLTDSLYSEVPEFKSYAQEYIDEEFLNNSYLTFGPFGSLLRDWIIGNSYPILVDKCYTFINNLCKKNDEEIEQMLKATFFEPLIDYKKSIEMSKLKLKNRALVLFDEVLFGPIFNGGKNAE